MKTFLTVLKNDYLRTVPRIAGLAVLTAVTLCSILLAVYVTGIQQVKGRIAVVAESAAAPLPHGGAHLAVTVLPKTPPRSALVKQEYDAVVRVDAQGRYTVDTLRGAGFQKLLAALLQNPDADLGANPAERKTGVNILGFMTMFLLMVSFANMFGFAEDKEQGQFRRIAAAPASFMGYLAAHCAYCFTLLLPTWLLLTVLRLFGWNIGFTLGQYAYLMAALGALGIGFSLLLHTLIDKPDNANMLGNAVTVLTSILAGSFYSLSKGSAVLDKIAGLLPQKALLDYALALQNGNAAAHTGGLLYPIGFALALFAISCVLLGRRYIKA